jgi:hypothetical protein
MPYILWLDFMPALPTDPREKPEETMGSRLGMAWSELILTTPTLNFSNPRDALSAGLAYPSELEYPSVCNVITLHKLSMAPHK